MSTRIALTLSLVFLAGCATGPGQYSASQSGAVDMLRFSTMDDMERSGLCHDYSQELGC